MIKYFITLNNQAVFLDSYTQLWESSASRVEKRCLSGRGGETEKESCVTLICSVWTYSKCCLCVYLFWHEYSWKPHGYVIMFAGDHSWQVGPRPVRLICKQSGAGTVDGTWSAVLSIQYSRLLALGTIISSNYNNEKKNQMWLGAQLNINLSEHRLLLIY